MGIKWHLIHQGRACPAPGIMQDCPSFLHLLISFLLSVLPVWCNLVPEIGVTHWQGFLLISFVCKARWGPLGKVCSGEHVSSGDSISLCCVCPSEVQWRETVVVTYEDKLGPLSAVKREVASLSISLCDQNLHDLGEAVVGRGWDLTCMGWWWRNIGSVPMNLW